MSTESQSIFATRPAVRFAVLFVVGILIAGPLNFNSWWILAAVVLLFIGCVILFVLHSSLLTMDVLLQILVVFAGLYLQSARKETVDTRRLNPVRGESMWFEGWIESEPVHQEKKVTFVVKTELLRRGSRQEFIERRILTTLRGTKGRNGPSALQCGARILGRATVEPFPFQRNPGEFDYGRYLTLNDIQAVATIAAPEDVVLTKESAITSFNALVGTMQRSLYRVIDQYHTPEQASFLKGVILGYRADLSNEIKQSFMNTGTIHILAVSGSNVAVIVLIIYSMFGLMRLPKKFVSAATIGGVVLFMFITGASPSVVRATIMAVVILLGAMFERKPDVYNSLSVAAVLILLLDTNSLFDVGFQLSFAAVLSIVYVYPILKKVIDRIPERFEEIKGVDYILQLFAVSFAAQIGTLPFTAYYFGRVSLVSLLANLIVVPLSGLNVLLGVATIVASVFSSFAASCYAALNKLSIDFLLGFVQQAGSVPFAYIETQNFEVLFTLMFYALIMVVLHLSNPKMVKWGAIAFLFLVTIYLGKEIAFHRTGVLRMTVIDVGQGDAILIETPGHKNILIDAGPRQFKFDAGERTIVPFLRRRGIASLDAIILTHGHSDHIGGAPFVVDHMEVKRVMDADVGGSSSLYRMTKESCRIHNVQWKDAERGQMLALDPAIRLYVLHPQLSEDSHRSLNNTSVVVKLVYGNRSVLLVGDAEIDAEGKICPRYGKFLTSDVLKVGHHGSTTSSGSEFLRLAQPVLSLVSVGMKNKFGHPSERTLNRLSKFGSQILRTDEEGAIVLESDGNKWWRCDWRNNQELGVSTKDGTQS